MNTNGRTHLMRVLAMAVLVLLAFAQPALAQAQEAPAGGTVTPASTAAARPAVGGELGALSAAPAFGRGSHFGRHRSCNPHGRHGRGSHFGRHAHCHPHGHPRRFGR